MKKLAEIKTDLGHIREYYRHRKMIGHPSRVISVKNLAQMIETYNSASEQASDILRGIYDGLYLRGLTQKSLAAELRVTEKYIQILHKRLLQYLVHIFSA